KHLHETEPRKEVGPFELSAALADTLPQPRSLIVAWGLCDRHSNVLQCSLGWSRRPACAARSAARNESRAMNPDHETAPEPAVTHLARPKPPGLRELSPRAILCGLFVA